jgi:hypothetical protein
MICVINSDPAINSAITKNLEFKNLSLITYHLKFLYGNGAHKLFIIRA